MTLHPRVRPTITLVAAAAMSLGGFTALAAPADAAVATSITASAPTAVTQSTKKRVTGTVKPGRPTRTVTLQRYAKKRWTKVTAARTVTRTGTFALTVPTAVVGVATYRVAVPAARGVRARNSKTWVTATKAKSKPITVGGSTVTVGVPAYVPGNPLAYAFLSSPGPSGTPARWDPCTPIGYRVNTSLASAGALADAQGAIERVAQATGLTFAYRGETTAIPGAAVGPPAFPADTALVIAWVTPGTTTHLSAAEALARTAGKGGGSWTFGHDRAGGPAQRLTEGFVVLDAGLALDAGFRAGPVSGPQGTRGQMLMHEIGHAVGLGHPSIADPTQIMYPQMSRKEAKWGAGDLAGLSLIGATNGCLFR